MAVCALVQTMYNPEKVGGGDKTHGVHLLQKVEEECLLSTHGSTTPMYEADSESSAVAFVWCCDEDQAEWILSVCIT